MLPVTGSVWLAQHTAILLLLLLLDSACFSDVISSAWLIFGFLRPVPPVPAHPSRIPSRDLAVERIRRYIAVKLDHLSERVGNFIQRFSDQLASLTSRVDLLARQDESQRAASTSFQVVTSAAPSIAGSYASSHDFNTLAEEIPPVPDFVVRLCSSLSASKLDFKERAGRAWEAGWWARFCAAGRINKVLDMQIH